MYTERSRDNFVIETPIGYNIDEFSYLYDKYDNEFEMYHSKHGIPLGLEVVYNPNILKEPIIQYWIRYFEKIGFKFNFEKDESMPGSGQAGFQLVRTNFQEEAVKVDIHQDNFRPAGLIIPLSFPQRIQWYDNEDNLLYDHNYTKITFINAGGQRHGVDYSPEPRWQFQLDCFNSWDEIKEIVQISLS